MQRLIDHLTQYAGYHRDARNVLTHLVGIPLIVVAVEILLSRPMLAVGGVPITPAMLASAAAAIFYLRLDARFGLAMAALLALSAWAGFHVAQLSTALWLATGVGLFVFGWALQFVGHHYEGRKPAFLDDVRGLIIGPLFIVAEVAFRMGLRRDVHQAVVARL